jgi:titin
MMAGDGILIAGSGNTIGGDQPGQGNLISGNGSTNPAQGSGSDGVHINSHGSNNLVLGNYIGTDITGTVALPNLRWGVGDNGYANTIGGLTPGAANVISGNRSDGVAFGGNLNVLEGNYIGTDPTGSSAVPNAGNGVNVAGGSTNTIGGPTPGAGNVISGNTKNGLAVTAGTGTLVEGNWIGTDHTGTAPLGNRMNGLLIQGSNNTIGGTTPGAGNIIGFNTLDGVQVMGNLQGGIPIGIQNGIQQNSIRGDGRLGIELTSSPANPNQFGNNGQAYPGLDTVASNGVTTTVQGSLSSTPYDTFTLEFFANGAPNPSGYGEGQTYMDSATVRTDANGYVAFTVTLNAGAADGQCVAATATDYLSNTSPFSLCVPVNGSDGPSLTVPRGVVPASAQPAGAVAPLTPVQTSPAGIPDAGSPGGAAPTDQLGNALPVGADGGANPSAPAAPQLLASAGGQPATEPDVPLGADLTAL